MMEGPSSNMRRRTRSSTAAAALSIGYNESSRRDNAQADREPSGDDDRDGQRNVAEAEDVRRVPSRGAAVRFQEREIRRYARRKGRNMSRIKHMCSKLGRLRLSDFIICIGVVAKLSSLLYYRCTRSAEEREVSSIVGSSSNDGRASSNDEWLPPERMPFRSPLLYNRGRGDQLAYAYLDDNDNGVHVEGKRNVRVNGMFQSDSYYADYKEEFLRNGYAVVDDVIFGADEYRDWTREALANSTILVSDDVENESFSLSAFGFDNEEEYRQHYFSDDDHFDAYYSFDDDHIKSTIGRGDFDNGQGDEEQEEDESGGESCGLPSFYHMYQPTCNEMHASLSGYQWLIGEDIYSRRWSHGKQSSIRSVISKYLSHGYYRDAFLLQSASDKVIFKTMRHMYDKDSWSESEETDDDRWGFDPNDKYTFINYKDDMRKDAMVMSLLSSSPRAIDIYSHCAMSSVIEFAPQDMEEYILPTNGYSPQKWVRRREGKNGVPLEPLNHYISPEEKLEIALEMAKCVAAMHGFEGGAIVHVDIQVGQFFRGEDGYIKIIDYNRAEPLLFDREHDEYCQFTNGQPGDGTNRAPEENVDGPLNEQADVYSLGNVFYSILTGKLVWQGYEFEERIEHIINGENLPIPELYNESPVSNYLVLAIQSCWQVDARHRPTVFDLVKFLEKGVAKYPVTAKAD